MEFLEFLFVYVYCCGFICLLVGIYKVVVNSFGDFFDIFRNFDFYKIIFDSR